MLISAIFKKALSLLGIHQHQWQADEQSVQEIDLGTGMAPAFQTDLKCTVCGASAIKTLHPLYGTSIKIINK